MAGNSVHQNVPNERIVKWRNPLLLGPKGNHHGNHAKQVPTLGEKFEKTMCFAHGKKILVAEPTKFFATQ
ncbi:MAG: hypothetical protein ACR2P4_02600 [Gammaproteobacteria bacterium]